MTDRHRLYIGAAAFAWLLPAYALGDGDSGHPLLQSVLLHAGAALVFGEIVELVDELRGDGRERLP